MRYKFLLTGLAVAALPLLAVSAPAAHAAVASPAPVHPFVPRSPVEAPASTFYCASGEAQVQWGETVDHVVAQWNSADNYFVEVTSGHTILCQKNEKIINGIPYWEYAAVLNGHETNDCVSIKNGVHAPIGLNGCSAGTNYLLWDPEVNGPNNTPPYFIQADAFGGDWIWFYGLGQPLQVNVPAFDDAYDWYTWAG